MVRLMLEVAIAQWQLNFLYLGNTMETVLIVIHLMVVAALVAVVLMQRSEGGALGMGGGGGGNSFFSARGAANALTRTTAILAATFFATSILLGVLSCLHRDSVLDNIEIQSPVNGDGEGLLNDLGGGTNADDGNADSEGSQVPTTQ